MSILAALQTAILRCTGTWPTDVYSSTDQVAREFADLANETATDIVAGHDWRALTSVASFVGDGVTEAFDPPADYGRMLADAEIDDQASWFWGYSPIASVNDWMRLKAGGGAIVGPGGWLILGGRFQFYPAPTGTAQFPYIRKTWAAASDGTPKLAFDADDDTFALSERLLALGLIWRWRAWKGLEYGEDMRNYEIALAQEQGRDKGARVLASVGPRFRGVRTAYPWALGPDII